MCLSRLRRQQEQTLAQAVLALAKSFAIAFASSLATATALIPVLADFYTEANAALDGWPAQEQQQGAAALRSSIFWLFDNCLLDEPFHPALPYMPPVVAAHFAPVGSGPPARREASKQLLQTLQGLLVVLGLGSLADLLAASGSSSSGVVLYYNFGSKHQPDVLGHLQTMLIYRTFCSL